MSETSTMQLNHNFSNLHFGKQDGNTSHRVNFSSTFGAAATNLDASGVAGLKYVLYIIVVTLFCIPNCKYM